MSVLLLVALLSGPEVVARVNARDEGVQVSRHLRMELVDRRGQRRVRETRSFRKYFDGEKRSVLFYLEPKNVRDTAFLTWDHPEPGREDDQWLYLPALRKSRRISATDRGDLFLGTDFTYEDVKLETKLGRDDYRWSSVGEESVDGHPCLLLEATPRDEATAEELGYGRLLLRVDSEIWIVRKGEYWDPGGEMLKTVHVRDIRQVDGIWTAHRVEAENHQNGHRTVFVFSRVDYESPLEDDLFTERALRRGWR